MAFRHNRDRLALEVKSGGSFTARPNTAYYVNANSLTLVTLPLVQDVEPGSRIIIVRTDSTGNLLRLSRSGSDTIDAATSYNVSNQYEHVEVMAHPTLDVWLIVSDDKLHFTLGNGAQVSLASDEVKAITTSNTAITWDTTDRTDPNGDITDDIGGSNPSRLTCGFTGTVLARGLVSIHNGARSDYLAQISLNGTGVGPSAWLNILGGGTYDHDSAFVESFIDVSNADYLELEARQVNGGSTSEAFTGGECNFIVTRVD